MRKGIQTDVLKRESRNQYRNHAFFSLEFEADEEGNGEGGEWEARTFDLEIIDDSDVQLRDTLLHAFRYIVLKNEERKRGDRAHSWDLSTEEMIARMRQAWDGRPTSPSNPGTNIKVDVSGWLQEREKERARAVSTSTVTTVVDEKKIEEKFLERKESETSELSFLSCAEERGEDIRDEQTEDGQNGKVRVERPLPPIIDGTPRMEVEQSPIFRQQASISPKRLNEVFDSKDGRIGLEIGS